MNGHSLVIGGTSGLGLATARKFSIHGYAVSVTGRSAHNNLSDTIGNIKGYILDSGYTKDKISRVLSTIVEKNGPLNNIIFCQRYRGKNDPWMGELETSLTLTKEIIENLEGRFDHNAESVSIVVVSSIFGTFVGANQLVGYHVAKAALIQMIKYYAVTLGHKRIRVNAVSPFTYLKEESKAYYNNNLRLSNVYKQIVPLGRLGTTEEIANVINFLCSQEASYITGQNIVIDGGLSLVWQESMARSIADV